MKLIIAGTRSLYVKDEEIRAMLEHHNLKPTEIVSGTCRGIDKCGEFFAKNNGIPLKLFPADWDKYGQRAGFRRNAEMSWYADALLLIWDGKSRGSASMRRLMLDERKPVFEFIDQTLASVPT